MLDANSGRPSIYYYGCLREEQSDVPSALEQMVYDHWDRSELAPPRARPSDPSADPDLLLMGWSNNQPTFPESLLTKFAEGSKGHKEIQAMNDELRRLFPSAGVQSNAPRQGRSNPRATGRPDYTIDGGAAPFDFSKALEKSFTPKSSFTVERRGFWWKHFF